MPPSLTKKKSLTPWLLIKRQGLLGLAPCIFILQRARGLFGRNSSVVQIVIKRRSLSHFYLDYVSRFSEILTLGPHGKCADGVGGW